MGIPQVPEQFNLGVYLTDTHITAGRGNRTAVYYQGETITYAELSRMVNRTGNVFRGLGIEIENRVVFILPDCPEFFYCFLGAMKIGAVPVAVNTLALPKDYVYFLNDSRSKLLVIHDSLLSKIEPVIKECKYLKNIVVVGEGAAGYPNFREITGKASDQLVPGETYKDDVAFWMYTSGTTGVPKGVVHLHHDMLHFVPPYCENVTRITEKDIVFTTSKMFFSYGRNNSFDAPLLYGAGVILCPDWPDANKVFDIIEKNKPTIFVSVPSFYASMIRELEKTGRKIDVSSIRTCTSSGEPLPKGLFERWKALTGLEILDILGSTDAGGPYLGNTPGNIRVGSSGRLLDGFEGKLVDPDGNEVPAGEIGTLWLKNDGTAYCYWNKHERSKQVFCGEWFNTGDRFRKDSDGFMWYEGREDEMLKVSGQWTSPLEIEAALSQHPAVYETAVIGAPDENGLVRSKSFVVLRDGFAPSKELEKEMINFVRDRIAHFKAPRWIEFLKEMPRTVTGKIQRHKLH